MEWMKYSRDKEHHNNDNKPRFFVPYFAFVDQEEEFDLNPADHVDCSIFDKLRDTLICKAALGRLLDFGYHQWIKMKHSIKNHEAPSHGMLRKRNKSKFFETEIKDDLLGFLSELSVLASPKTTLFVREVTGSGLREEEEGIVELPPHFSKRQLFQRYASERGWNIELSSRGNVSVSKKVEGDSIVESKPICSWGKFLRTWQKEFPKLRIQKPSEDICSLCHTFQNRWRYLDGRDCEEDNEAIRLEIREAVHERKTVPFVLEEEKDLSPKQKLLREAFLHVESAIAQRLLCNRKIEEAVTDVNDNKPHSECRRTIVMDYSQNGCLPYCGSSQPGEIYYCTPLNISIFGIVDCGIDGGRLDAFVYHDGQGKKGGNNVASLLWLYLQRKGWLQENVTGKQLTVIMDNCPGQNKNNTVLRMAPLLVEMGFFETVSFTFYVVGHTKNACDRWFNTLKRSYRRSDIWSMEVLISKLKELSDLITIHEIEEGDFKDWHNFLNTLYDKIQGGQILCNHIFTSTIHEDTPSTLKIDRNNLGLFPSHKQEMNPLKRNPNNRTDEQLAYAMGLRDGFLHIDAMDEILDEIKGRGIKEETLVELGTKWRRLCPQEYKDDLCKVPSQALLDRFREKAKTKRETQAKRLREPPKPPRNPSDSEPESRGEASEEALIEVLASDPNETVNSERAFLEAAIQPTNTEVV